MDKKKVKELIEKTIRFTKASDVLEIGKIERVCNKFDKEK